MGLPGVARGSGTTTASPLAAPLFNYTDINSIIIIIIFITIRDTKCSGSYDINILNIC